MQKRAPISLRRLVAILGIAMMVITFFNVMEIAGTGSGTTPSIYMQNGALNVTQLYVNGINITSSGAGAINASGSLSELIFTNSSGYYAVNGTTGNIDYFNATDPTQVIQSAVNATGQKGGGRIFIRNGVYPLTGRSYFGGTTINASIFLYNYSYMDIEGESWNTILKLNNGTFNCFYFYGYAKNDGDSVDQPNEGCTIANLQIDGGSNKQWDQSDWNMQNGIQTRNTYDSTFQKLYIHDMGRTAIYNTEHGDRNLIFDNYLTHNYRYGISYTSSSRGRVIGNYVKDNYNYGMNWDATIGNTNATTVADNIFENCTDVGLYVVGNSESAGTREGTVTGNTFIDYGTHSGSTSSSCLTIQYGQFLTVTGNSFYGNSTNTNQGSCINIGWSSDLTVSSNVFTADFAGSQVYNGIAFSGTPRPQHMLVTGNSFNLINGIGVNAVEVWNLTVTGNQFFGAAGVGPTGDSSTAQNVFVIGNTFACTTPIGAGFLSGATPRIIKNNYGFFTEANGVAVNNTATTFSISHTLSGTPTTVICSFNATWTAEEYTWTATSSTITVTVAGTMGSNKTCYWEAVYVP